ncbi:uncharacterized protein LOC133825829 [Humulus lupulus]|uniref:uncharacterized protein LOC133825829 n=1 Tax=Humulus lupulus TaxID=3486 RepID=UPI002B40AC95|nr:uncharacterized protein LOC133825829 [Humulus lupulus]
MQCSSPILGSNQNLDGKFGKKRAEEGNSKSVVKIDLADIEDEILFWNSALVCYVLGANPPLNVFYGYVRRKWKDKGVDKVGLLAPSVFLVRFQAINTRDEILHGGYLFLDKKPVVMKPWDAYSDYSKDDVRSVPIWVQLHNLDLKYWGERSYSKNLGNWMGQEFPDTLSFLNEIHQEIEVKVKYEWLPVVCGNCSGMGCNDPTFLN